MPKAYYVHSFHLQGQDEIDFVTCKCKFKVIEIIRRGIKECLKDCPNPPKKVIQKAKDLIR